MATQEDRSLSAGMFFPKWMKSKINDTLDLDQSALSPTELDDSFMYYYRHPLKRNGETRNVTPNVMDSKIISASQITATNKTAGFPDITVTTTSEKRLSQTNTKTESSVSMKIKSKGTDDGFKGETAKVGSSVVRVANQMVSGKLIQGYTKPEEECEQLLEKFDPYRRRGSKSLPASPLSSPSASPKSKRRVNKYFTGPFVDSEKAKGSWILSNLLARREMSQSMSYIGEENKEELEKANSTASIDGISVNSKNKTSVFTAKPSELREMNFWSPTSM